MIQNPSERRSRVRHVVQGDLTGHVLKQFESAKQEDLLFSGKILNASTGGLCVLTFQRVSPFELIQCNVNLDGWPAPIPTLVQVQWIEKTALEKGQRVGLQYILSPSDA